MFKPDLERIGELIYDLCLDRSKSTREVVDELDKEIGFYSQNRLKIEEAVSRYKNSGAGLEETTKTIIELRINKEYYSDY